MKSFYEQKCRICGCDWNHACNDHDYWFAEDLCSACAEKMKPILFNSQMVRAILDGQKTTTRRIIKPKYKRNFIGTDIRHKPMECRLVDDETQEIICNPQPPFAVNDILYVRETFCPYDTDDVIDGVKYAYKADATADSEEARKELGYKWHPSIHMPKEAARIFLRVTDVRAERLQDITEDGAKAEGAINNHGFIHSPDNEYDTVHTAREHFSEIWNSTVKKADIDKYGWNANPWVWVIKFERIETPQEA